MVTRPERDGIVWHSRANILKQFVSVIAFTALVVPSHALPCPVCAAHATSEHAQSAEKKDAGCGCSCSLKGHTRSDALAVEADRPLEDSSQGNSECPRDCGAGCIALCCAVKPVCQSSPDMDFDYQLREGGLACDLQSARPSSTTPNGLLRPPRD